MNVECYGQRLLNPFRGVMHVVRYASAEAVTLDGVDWDIYVANDSLLAGLDPNTRAQVSDIRYGSWNQSRGLNPGPIYPSEDFRRMAAQGAIVHESLRRLHASLPFPLKDCDECWLMDVDGRPLALLHSALPDDTTRRTPEAAWKAGLAAHERFRDPTHPDSPEAARRLEGLIRGRAGKYPLVRWFRRLPDGSGRALDDTANRLAEAAFPRLFISAEGLPDDDACLLRAYLDWQAAWLLTLPGLPAAERCRLETCARMQPGIVERLHRLYPETVDIAAINAARVEARLTARQAGEPVDPGAASTFYIELNPQGGGYT
jgi:hypothetical protein